MYYVAILHQDECKQDGDDVVGVFTSKGKHLVHVANSFYSVRAPCINDVNTESVSLCPVFCLSGSQPVQDKQLYTGCFGA